MSTPGDKLAIAVVVVTHVGPLFWAWCQRIRANVQARRAGKPLPYPVGGLIGDAVDMTEEAVEDTARETPSAKAKP